MRFSFRVCFTARSHVCIDCIEPFVCNRSHKHLTMQWQIELLEKITFAACQGERTGECGVGVCDRIFHNMIPICMYLTALFFPLFTSEARIHTQRLVLCSNSKLINFSSHTLSAAAAAPPFALVVVCVRCFHENSSIVNAATQNQKRVVSVIG